MTRAEVKAAKVGTRLTLECEGCGAEIVWVKKAGRIPQWCSDHCRKGQYHGTCKDCGGKTYNSGSRAVPDRCDSCNKERRIQQARERIVNAMQRWVEIYGRPPSAYDWNPGMGELRGLSTAAEKRRIYEAGDWPPTSGVQNAFGSWAAGLRAAGLTSNPTGRPKVVA